MPAVQVIQHTDGEYLGRVEDHLEGRGIAFQYVRPHVAGSWFPDSIEDISCLFLMGGGPWGGAGEKNLPIIMEEVSFVETCLAADIPVVGFGLGSQILCHAAGGGSDARDLRFDLTEFVRTDDEALNGFLPERMPAAVYMRDWPQPPSDANILARDLEDRPAVFQIGERSVGFANHPGFKLGMIEDLIMEFDDFPPDTGDTLLQMHALQNDMEDALVYMMTGLVQVTELMQRQKLGRNPAALKSCAA